VERLQCEIRLMHPGDESILLLLAEQNLRPLAWQSGHPERYHADELLHLLRDAEVFVAAADDEVAGYVAVEDEAGDRVVRISSSTGSRVWPSTAERDVSKPSSPPATRPRCTCTAATISRACPIPSAPS
jgi:hypothetical protein